MFPSSLGWLFPAPQIGQTSRTPHTAKQTAFCSASFTSRCQLTSEETTKTTTNERASPSFHECICSPSFVLTEHISTSPHLHESLPTAPALNAIKATPHRIRDWVWLWYGGSQWGKAICFDLNPVFLVWWYAISTRLALLDTAQTRREPGSNNSHPHMFSYTQQRLQTRTHPYPFIPGYVSSPGCQSNIHNNILLDFQQQHLSLPACLFPFFFIIFCKKRNHNMKFVNIAEEPLFHSPCLYYCNCALSDKACLYY